MNFAFQEQTAAVEDLQIPLDNHSDLFGPHMDEESALPSVEIRLKDPDEIVWVPPRRLSQREEEIVNEEVEELLQMDTITRSTSTFDTPIVVVEQKGNLISESKINMLRTVVIRYLAFGDCWRSWVVAISLGFGERLSSSSCDDVE